MRTLLVVGTAVLLLAGPAYAQSSSSRTHTSQAYMPRGCNARIPDCGPTTPDADNAFAGGGVVLVNPSGGPPPRATQPLPPMPPGAPMTYEVR